MTNKNNSKFKLSKWYLDCISEKGDVIIVYSAELRWNKIVIPYNSVLVYNSDGNTILKKSRFNRKATPQQNEEQINLVDPVFGFEGNWGLDHSPLNIKIYESTDGFLSWHCFQPRSKVRLKIKNIGSFTGFGYAEKLDMTIEPWKIPMNQIRWGRYNSATDNMVWIELDADPDKQWVWYNGELSRMAEICDDSVLIPDIDLKITFTETRIIEAEKKISNVVGSLLSYIPGINKSIPLSFLNARETKWLSCGELIKNGEIHSLG